MLHYHECEVLTADQERDLVGAALAGDDSARNRIVMSMYPLVLREAAKVARKSGRDVGDVVNVGVARIVARFNSFDPSLGFRCSTYFLQAAVREMWTFVNLRDNVIVLPQDMNNMPEHLRPLAENARGVASLSAAMGDDREFGDVFADTRTPDASHNAEVNEQREVLRAAIRFLDERSRQIILMRQEGKTLEEAGAHFGITKERARQIEHKAMGKIRDAVARGVARPARRTVVQVPGIVVATVRKFAPWTEAEAASLRDLSLHYRISEVADMLGRSRGSTYAHAQRAGIEGLYHEALWTGAEDEFLRQNRDRGWVWCAAMLKRSSTSVRSRVKRIGIQNKMLRDHDVAELLRLHAAGLSNRLIGQELGVTHECVRVQLKNRGIKPNPRDEAARTHSLSKTLMKNHGVGSIGEVAKLRAAERSGWIAAQGFGDVPGAAAVVLMALRNIGEGSLDEIRREVLRIAAAEKLSWIRRASKVYLYGGLRFLVARGDAVRSEESPLNRPGRWSAAGVPVGTPV